MKPDGEDGGDGGNGGGYGTGSMGTETTGKNGKWGADGKAKTINTTSAEVWKSDVCFVHPVQCRMLLDKANVEWFCGSDPQRAKAANIIEELQQRLYFLSSDSAASRPGQPKGPDEPLVKAYRAAEKRLNIVSWASTDVEPISLTQLRAIKKEADASLLHIRAGDDIYAWGAHQVPRLSYSLHQRKATEFLNHLSELEDMYHTVWDSEKAVEVRKTALRRRAARHEASRTTTRMLMDALKREKDDLIRGEYDNLSPSHPTMLALVKRMYQDAIRHTQMWLFKQQRAYSFLALDNTNIIGLAMEDFDFSSFDATTLKDAQSEIDQRHIEFLEQAAQPPQTYYELAYQLDRDYLSAIQGGGTYGVALSVRIPTSGPPGQTDPFEGMADIRLLKARLFAKGATTRTNRLAVFLTHCGDEIIMNKSMRHFKFGHDPLTVQFKYNLETGECGGPDTTDGVIGSVDGSSDKYALVGPYTTWKIKIGPDSNDGLDLTKVTEARLEFDFQYRAVARAAAVATAV